MFRLGGGNRERKKLVVIRTSGFDGRADYGFEYDAIDKQSSAGENCMLARNNLRPHRFLRICGGGARVLFNVVKNHCQRYESHVPFVEVVN